MAQQGGLGTGKMVCLGNMWLSMLDVDDFEDDAGF